MNCCNQAGHCTQGEGCAIRRANETPFTREHTVRRYRAGEPADQPLPPLPIDVAEPDEDVTSLDLVMGGACIVLCVFILAVVLDTVGWL